MSGGPWHEGAIVGFDLETTGTDPLSAQVVTAAIVEQLPDGTVGERSRNWLVDPGVEIPAAATAVHGITTEYARQHGAAASEATAQIADALEGAWTGGLPIIVFNAAYDLTLLNAALIRCGARPLPDRAGWAAALIIDPLVIDRAVDRFRRGKRTLQDMTTHYQVLATDAHSADGDAVATCRLARAIARRFPEIGSADSVALRSQQAVWSSEWAARFQAYLRSQGKADALIDGTWPLRAG